MYINIEKTLASISRDLLKEKESGIAELKRAYAQTLRLQSQLLSLIYDAEAFGRSGQEKPFAWEMAKGMSSGAEVILTIQKPLPLPSPAYVSNADIQVGFKAVKCVSPLPRTRGGG